MKAHPQALSIDDRIFGLVSGLTLEKYQALFMDTTSWDRLSQFERRLLGNEHPDKAYMQDMFQSSSSSSSSLPCAQPVTIHVPVARSIVCAKETTPYIVSIVKVNKDEDEKKDGDGENE